LVGINFLLLHLQGLTGAVLDIPAILVYFGAKIIFGTLGYDVHGSIVQILKHLVYNWLWSACTTNLVWQRKGAAGMNIRDIQVACIFIGDEAKDITERLCALTNP
jgi:membrane protease YdiL (CAAX protease family)